MTRRLRRATFLALLVLGCFGLLGTGSGVLAGPSWVWLAVLVLAVLAQVAGDHYSARQRLARRTERRLSDMWKVIEKVQRDHAYSHERLKEDIAAVGTPESMKALVDNVNRMVNDLKPMREDWESVRAAGGWRSLLKR